jgi:6,7-dimethyl-8-ribityllumazine synthase
MPLRKLPVSTRAEHMRVGIVLSRFNPAIGELLLKGAARALQDSGVGDTAIVVITVPGALESPLALQRMAQTDDYDALVALGAVIRGETYHFEIVANESASGVARVQLEFGIPIGNGILTTETDEQALERADTKGFEAAQAALELSNLLDAIDER